MFAAREKLCSRAPDGGPADSSSLRDLEALHLPRIADVAFLNLRANQFALCARDGYEALRADRINGPVPVVAKAEMLPVEGRGHAATLAVS